MAHQLMHCLTPPPPLQRFINHYPWPAYLMVCRRCWQVELHTRIHRGLHILIVNQGEDCEECLEVAAGDEATQERSPYCGD